MSTNSECLFLQVKADEWFYILEHSNAPKNSWDWREHADAFGPFLTEAAADEHLRDNHANPGGSCTEPLPDGIAELALAGDVVLEGLITEARARNSRERAIRHRW